MNEETLKVGDKMRFSTALIKKIREDGDQTNLVRIVKIEDVPDGTKVAWLENVDE